jgi:glycosyltransferase involved in cell wall biosynthesis
MGSLVDELLLAGHDVQWLVAPIDLEHPEVARLRKRGAMVERLPREPKSYIRVASLRRKVDRILGGERSLEEVVRESGPDHIFVNDGGTWSGAGGTLFNVLQTNKGRYSIISHLNQSHAAFGSEGLECARLLAMNAKEFFFNSKWSHRLAEEQIARAIDNAAFYQLPLRAHPDAPLAWPQSGPARFAMVTRLDAWHKGLDVALLAFDKLRKDNAEAHLTIIGRGNDEAYLRELASYLELGEFVTFKPYEENLADVWANEEVLLLPSRFEGLGVSMLEAMSFGRPVLRTPYGGCEEWIEDGVNGFVCPAAEVDLLVATLKRALAERHRWREMGLAAHAKIKRDLDPRPARVFLEALRP